MIKFQGNALVSKNARRTPQLRSPILPSSLAVTASNDRLRSAQICVRILQCCVPPTLVRNATHLLEGKVLPKCANGWLDVLIRHER
jgi:hypothetical protein